MRALKFVGNVAMWLLATLGVLSVLVWGATQLGYIKPLVVISGSMEPKIMTGDLLVDVPRATAQVQAGQVTSVYSDVTHNLVSHRVVDIQPTGDGHWAIHMKGDANTSQDGGTYVVSDHVWQPAVRIAGGGYVLTTITRPSVAVPLAVTLLALLGLSLLPGDNRSPRRPVRHGSAHAAAPGRSSAANATPPNDHATLDSKVLLSP